MLVEMPPIARDKRRPEKLIVAQVIKRNSALKDIGTFPTLYVRTSHWTLSSATFYSCRIRQNTLTLSTRQFPMWPFPSRFEELNIVYIHNLY
jgi:hypothetical protein